MKDHQTEQEQQAFRKRALELLRVMLPDWRPTGPQVLWGIRITIGSGLLLAILTFIGYTFDISLWEWSQALIIPAVIAGVGIWFNQQQKKRELYMTDLRAQEDALEAYLDQMSQLLTNKGQLNDQSPRAGTLTETQRVVARARTFTTLERLAGDRKGSVVQLLYESDLITNGHRVINLNRANLEWADLKEFFLKDVDLSGASLNNVWLRRANLVNANLTEAYFMETDLRGADLSRADLTDAVLDDSNLCSATLKKTNLRGASLRRALLHPPRLELKGINRLTAYLTGFSSQTAFMLKEYGGVADLTEADLSGADLTYATVTEEQLDKCKSLKGTTMPDGSTHP